MSSLKPGEPSSSHPSSPHLTTSSPISLVPYPNLPTPSSPYSSTLQRQNSRSSHRSGLVPSPNNGHTILPSSSATPSASSSASGSKTASFISTPKLLSRRSSTKDSQRPSTILARKDSSRNKGKGKGKEEDEVALGSGISRTGEAHEGWRSPLSESGSAEVIETPQLVVERDPGTGRKMINQYLVLEEIGHGTHGRVRLGRDMSVELPTGDEGDIGLGITGNAFYAIKIVDRNPKKKRLTGFSRQKSGFGRTDGVKMVNESEIRKEIAIFKKVNHPNVVRMKEIIDDPDSSKLYMILEYCENGEIHWKDEDGSPALTVREIRRIFRDTLLGLEYLHHQGIIHRDIKPSNLLVAADGTVKISDFGCSHYSEALRVASAHTSHEGEAYIDDIELAKTAGSPAFFAPEMCYSGLDNDIGPRRSLSPTMNAGRELPALTLRPPSVLEDQIGTKASRSDPLVLSPGGRPSALKPTISNDSALSRRPDPVRTHSSSTVLQRDRLPITNAIDVWALGVTLYCLLFGKTPFDAPNEYLLMQVIPTSEYEIPPVMGKDHMRTGREGGLGESSEARECLDLLKCLLEKSPEKRISPEHAKKHPFTLRGLSDPGAWLASTDPHAQSFVTVSNDEVAAVVTKSGSFRDKFRKGIKSISHKLQIFAATGRGRSRSIGDGESAVTSAHTSMTPSSAASQVSLHSVPQDRNASLGLAARGVSGNKEKTPATSPPISLSRRFSSLGSNAQDGPPIRHQVIQLASPDSPTSPTVMSSPHPAEDTSKPTRTPTLPAHPAFVVHRPNKVTTSQVTSSVHPEGPVLPQSTHSPRPMASSSSLDKLKNTGDLSPTKNLRRRQSSDIDGRGLQRTPSDASSMGRGFGSKLVRLLSRNSSQRSRFRKRDKATSASSDIDDSLSVSTGTSPVDAIRRISLDEGLPLRSLEVLDPNGNPTMGSTHLTSDQNDRLGALSWETRLRNGPAIRRGSSLSEGFTRGVEEEDVDWNEPLSDDDDYEGPPSKSMLPQSAPNLPPDWHHANEDTLGLIVSAQAIEPSTPHKLDPIPDGSPSPSNNVTSPHSPTFPSEFGRRSLSRTNARPSPSPLRPSIGPERTRSPMSPVEDSKTSPARSGLSRQPNDPAHEGEEADEGLAISTGSRRGRKGSILDRNHAGSVVHTS